MKWLSGVGGMKWWGGGRGGMKWRRLSSGQKARGGGGKWRELQPQPCAVYRAPRTMLSMLSMHHTHSHTTTVYRVQCIVPCTA